MYISCTLFTHITLLKENSDVIVPTHMPTLNHMGAVFTAHFQFRLCIINLCACQVSLMHFTPLHSTAGLSRGCASLTSKWAVHRFAHEPDQARVRLVGYIIRFVESIIKPLWFFHLSFSLSFIISFPKIRPWAFLQLWCKTAQSTHPVSVWTGLYLG